MNKYKKDYTKYS